MRHRSRRMWKRVCNLRMHHRRTPNGMTSCGMRTKINSAQRRSIMRRDITAELKELRLHGMTEAWNDLNAQGTSTTDSSQCFTQDMLQRDTTSRSSLTT